MKYRVFNRKPHPMSFDPSDDPMDSLIIPPMSKEPLVLELTKEAVERGQKVGLRIEPVTQ